jgi:hypothetical protein
MTRTLQLANHFRGSLESLQSIWDDNHYNAHSTDETADYQTMAGRYNLRNITLIIYHFFNHARDSRIFL